MAEKCFGQILTPFLSPYTIRAGLDQAKLQNPPRMT